MSGSSWLSMVLRVGDERVDRHRRDDGRKDGEHGVERDAGRDEAEVVLLRPGRHALADVVDSTPPRRTSGRPLVGAAFVGRAACRSPAASDASWAKVARTSPGGRPVRPDRRGPVGRSLWSPVTWPPGRGAASHRRWSRRRWYAASARRGRPARRAGRGSRPTGPLHRSAAPAFRSSGRRGVAAH